MLQLNKSPLCDLNRLLAPAQMVTTPLLSSLVKRVFFFFLNDFRIRIHLNRSLFSSSVPFCWNDFMYAKYYNSSLTSKKIISSMWSVILSSFESIILKRVFTLGSGYGFLGSKASATPTFLFRVYYTYTLAFPLPLFPFSIKSEPVKLISTKLVFIKGNLSKKVRVHCFDRLS